MIEFGRAETEAERTEVARFFYSVYVEEMGRFRGVADHQRRELRDPEDAYSWLFTARDSGRIVATCRLTWGGDGLSERQIHQYSLEPFLTALPAETLAVGERAMVAADYRGSNLYGDLGKTTAQMVEAHGILLGFGASEPHLVPMYLRLGQRPYAPRNFWSEESGYMVPNVSIPGDLAAAEHAAPPPISGMAFDWSAGAVYQSFPSSVRQLLDGFGTVRAVETLGTDNYWHEVRSALERVEPSGPGVFDGMSDDAIGSCIRSSILLDCYRDDHVVKRGGTARNMYVVLSGAFEARDGDRVIRALGAGDVFGESGFLLGELRTADVYVTSDRAQVLSLSERTLRNVVDGSVDGSRQLLRNLVSILANRLASSAALTG